MIPAGYVNALYAWAINNEARTADLIAERDALVTAFLSGGNPSTTLTSASLNGKSFTALASLTHEDKLALLTEVLDRLGVIDSDASPIRTTYGAFDQIVR